MPLPRGSFVIVAVASLGVGTASAHAQVIQPRSSSEGITGGTVYLLRFADEVTLPPIEYLRQWVDWLGSSSAVVPVSRVERIDQVIRAFQQRRSQPEFPDDADVPK